MSKTNPSPRQSAYKRSALQAATAATAHYGSLRAYDSIALPPDDLDAVDQKLLLASALDVLEPSELKIIALTYVDEGKRLTDEKIAAKLGYANRLQVVRARARALEKMRAALTADNRVALAA